MRLIRLASMSWFVIMLAIGSAMLYGRSHAETPKLEAIGFSMCNDRLCFLGIAPGVTPRGKALDILAEHGAVQPNLSFSIGSQVISVEYDSQRQVVGNLSMMDKTHIPLPLTVGDTMQYLGTPCKFDVGMDGIIFLYFSHTIVTLISESSGVNPTTRIIDIDLTSESSYCSNHPIQWPGFTTYTRYEYLSLNTTN